MKIFSIDKEWISQRLDKFLASKMEGTSRSKIQELIKNNFVQINQQVQSDPNFRLNSGEISILQAEKSYDITLQPKNIALDIIYEDEDLLVVNKQAGLTTHPGVGNNTDTLVNALLAYCANSLSKVGGDFRPGIVHRLDKDTSGLMVVAKNDEAHFNLSKQIETRGLKRTYLALCYGDIIPKVGIINARISRSRRDHKKMQVVQNGGKIAVTKYKVEKSFLGGLISLARCNLDTGRTHQIRVHMDHLEHSIIGDQTYNSSKRKYINKLPDHCREQINHFSRQALHSTSIAFLHPKTSQILQFESQVANDMQELITCLNPVCSS